MATLKDIAKHVGISISAASLALRDHHSISLETKRKVWEAQETLGYRAPLRAPDSIAKKVKRQRTAVRNVVFLLVDRKFENSSYGPIFQKVADHCAERHWRSIFLSASLKDLREGSLPPLLKNDDLDGIIVSGAYDAVAHQHVRKLGIPIVALGRYQLGDDPWAACEPDFEHAVRLFFSRMTAFGHQRYGLVVIGEKERSSYLNYLLRAFNEVLDEKNLEFAGLAATRNHQDNGFLTMEELLLEKPTALLISSASLAESTYEACRKTGLRIPEDISIMCFADTANFIISPSLACIRKKSFIGRGLVEKLGRMMDDPDAPQTREIFPQQFVPGGSIGLCPGVSVL